MTNVLNLNKRDKRDLRKKCFKQKKKCCHVHILDLGILIVTLFINHIPLIHFLRPPRKLSYPGKLSVSEFLFTKIKKSLVDTKSVMNIINNGS